MNLQDVLISDSDKLKTWADLTEDHLMEMLGLPLEGIITPQVEAQLMNLSKQMAYQLLEVYQEIMQDAEEEETYKQECRERGRELMIDQVHGEAEISAFADEE